VKHYPTERDERGELFCKLCGSQCFREGWCDECGLQDAARAMLAALEAVTEAVSPIQKARAMALAHHSVAQAKGEA
jgi:hypothetical protein